METLTQNASKPKRAYPYVVATLGILLVVAALVGVAAFRSARRRMDSIQSASNMREIDAAVIIYADDHDGQLPSTLADLVMYGNLDPAKLVAPWGTATVAAGSTPKEIAAEINGGGHCSYTYLGAGLTSDELTPSTLILYEDDGANPDGTTFCWFGDGHGETMTTPQLAKFVVAPLMDRYKALMRATTEPTTKTNR